MTAANEELIRRFIQAGNDRDWERIWDCFDPDVRFPLRSGVQGRTFGLADYQRLLRDYYRALPDVHFEIEDMLADEQRIWARIVITGTHRGLLRGVPATGRRVQYTQIGMYRTSRQGIVEAQSVFDDATLLRQMGAINV